MKTVTLDLEDNKISLLQDISDRLGIPLNDLLKAAIDDILASPSSEFEELFNYLESKNKELYKRLAK